MYVIKILLILLLCTALLVEGSTAYAGDVSKNPQVNPDLQAFYEGPLNEKTISDLFLRFGAENNGIVGIALCLYQEDLKILKPTLIMPYFDPQPKRLTAGALYTAERLTMLHGLVDAVLSHPDAKDFIEVIYCDLQFCDFEMIKSNQLDEMLRQQYVVSYSVGQWCTTCEAVKADMQEDPACFFRLSNAYEGQMDPIELFGPAFSDFSKAGRNEDALEYGSLIPSQWQACGLGALSFQ